MLTDFQLAYPDIKLDLDFDNRKVDVIEDGFDAVIRSGNLVYSELAARRLGAFGTVIVGEPAYLEANGRHETPENPSAHRCAHFRNRQTGKLQPWHMTLPGDELEPQPPTSVICNTSASQHAFVLKGPSYPISRNSPWLRTLPGGG